MQRSPQSRSFQPRDEIDPNRSEEIQYWSRRLSCTPEELHEALQRVGPRAAAVATEFGVPLPPG